MTSSPTNADDAADLLYARRRTLAAAIAKPVAQPTDRWGVHQWIAFLSTPSIALPVGQQRALFADKRLREDFRQLKRVYSVAALPALAAASDGDVVERSFEGGTVRIHAARKPGQFYVRFSFGIRDAYPRVLVLELPDGTQVKRLLPAMEAGGDGEMLIVGDMAAPADQTFRQLLADPASHGDFLGDFLA